MAFDLSQYETVESRLEKFIEDFPDFRVDTRMEKFEDGRFIVRAAIYRTFADDQPFSTGYAEEKISDRGVNATSALENCETSAIGRALANAGYAAKGKRASQSEMAKVARITNDKASEAIANAPLAINNTWDEFVGKEPTEEPISLASAAELVQQTFAEAEPIPSCSHGARTIKSGVSAAGKPWQGALCEVRGASKGDRCQPIWYVMSKTTGKWRLPEGVE